MNTAFRIQYEDQEAARAAADKLLRMPEMDALSVAQLGSSVQIEFRNPLLSGLSAVIAAIFGSLAMAVEKLSEATQRTAPSK